MKDGDIKQILEILDKVTEEINQAKASANNKFPSISRDWEEFFGEIINMMDNLKSDAGNAEIKETVKKIKGLQKNEEKYYIITGDVELDVGTNNKGKLRAIVGGNVGYIDEYTDIIGGKVGENNRGSMEIFVGGDIKAGIGVFNYEAGTIKTVIGGNVDGDIGKYNEGKIDAFVVGDVKLDIGESNKGKIRTFVYGSVGHNIGENNAGTIDVFVLGNVGGLVGYENKGSLNVFVAGSIDGVVGSLNKGMMSACILGSANDGLGLENRGILDSVVKEGINGSVGCYNSGLISLSMGKEADGYFRYNTGIGVIFDHGDDDIENKLRSNRGVVIYADYRVANGKRTLAGYKMNVKGRTVTIKGDAEEIRAYLREVVEGMKTKYSQETGKYYDYCSMTNMLVNRISNSRVTQLELTELKKCFGGGRLCLMRGHRDKHPGD